MLLSEHNEQRYQDCSGGEQDRPGTLQDCSQLLQWQSCMCIALQQRTYCKPTHTHNIKQP